MDVYLSATSTLKKEFLSGTINPSNLFVLESYYSLNEWQQEYIKKFDKFMLDSGAYTFRMAQKGGKRQTTDFVSYADEYADFVKDNDVKLFFELDIDNIVGYSEVRKIRARLESRVGRQPIPVWHINRGKEDFVAMCKDYDYVAIGGIVGKAVIKVDEKYYPWFIDSAHEHGAKIHGLGYTNTKKNAPISLG